MCNKTRRLIGMIYRNRYSDPTTLSYHYQTKLGICFLSLGSGVDGTGSNPASVQFFYYPFSQKFSKYHCWNYIELGNGRVYRVNSYSLQCLLEVRLPDE
jgi:hypothetical protein